MWLSIIGVVALVSAGFLLYRVQRKVEEFERATFDVTDHDKRLRDLEVWRKQMNFSGEHAVVAVPDNVHPRVVDYSKEPIR
jgi:hypothetical protein